MKDMKNARDEESLVDNYPFNPFEKNVKITSRFVTYKVSKKDNPDKVIFISLGKFGGFSYAFEAPSNQEQSKNLPTISYEDFIMYFDQQTYWTPCNRSFLPHDYSEIYLGKISELFEGN